MEGKKTFVKAILRKYRFLTIGLSYLLVCTIIFLTQALTGWQGKVSFCIAETQCFCEYIDMDAVLREKRQSWSNFSLIISGLVILFLTDRTRPPISHSPDSGVNPMAAPGQFSLVYGLLTINIGVGSFWFHASLLRYAEFLDVFAMNLYIIFFLAYSLTRYLNKSGKFLLWVYIPIGLVVGIGQAIVNDPNISVWFFSILAGLGMAGELVLQILAHKYNKFPARSRRWLWYNLGVGCFFLGYLIWNLSLPGEILCDPYSWLQGHAFWHWAVGASTFFIYLFLKSEK